MAKTKKAVLDARWVKRNQNKHLCKCGCGEYITVVRKHKRKSIGIPKFIKNHNLALTSSKQEKIMQEPNKGPSNWEGLSKEEKEIRLSKLKVFKKGDKNPSWVGGIRKDAAGYIQILTPDHPMARLGYMAEHRLVVEKRTRDNDPDIECLTEIEGILYLKTSAVVHHIDEVKHNNKSENLMLLVNQSAHAFLHNSPLPMKEILRRISLGIFNSKPIREEE